ncbi:SMP-30/gluconolactonase/LRE family protein [Mycobacterium sp. 4858]|uniref:SMP-30/gluconolactonase/LRE family protein n=1 Tax=Mycobacterium sp. 4858 TaxID=2057185 RepID=UPI000C854BCC|nr:SMP-30/gluconolactonase/LRE family protein [Mycobacterium sp. 4858]
MGTDILHDDLRWGESPRVFGNELWISDTQAGQLVTIDTVSHAVTRRDLDSPTNGLWFLPDGRLAAARWCDKRIDVFVDETFSVYADLSAFARDRLGDMVGGPDGRLYVDDMGPDPHSGRPVGRLLTVGPDATVAVAADQLQFPNGLAIVDSTLIVAETHGNRLTAFDIGAQGQLIDRRVWTDLAHLFDQRHRPDGIWPAPDGSIWVATTTGERFVRVRGNDVLDQIDTPGQFAVACCLNDSTLYYSTSQTTDPALDLLTEALAQRKIRGKITRAAVATVRPVTSGGGNHDRANH